MVCISWVCVSWSGFNKNCHLNSERCLFGIVSKEDGEKVWPKVCNTFSPPFGGFSNVPKCTSVLLIQKRHLYVLRPCSEKMPQLSIPILSLLYKEHPMQPEILQDCPLGVFCILPWNSITILYYFSLLLLLLFFLIQSWPWPQFLMSELKQWKGLHSILFFPVLSFHISKYLWLKHSSAASHHTLPNHRVEALLWLGCKLFSANNSWHMSCLSFTMTLLQSLSVWKHLHETWLDLKTYKFPNAE